MVGILKYFGLFLRYSQVTELAVLLNQIYYSCIKKKNQPLNRIKCFQRCCVCHVVYLREIAGDNADTERYASGQTVDTKHS